MPFAALKPLAATLYFFVGSDFTFAMYHFVRWSWWMGDGSQLEQTNATLLLLNTIYNGQCYVWTASIKGKLNEPTVVFRIKVPDDKWVFEKETIVFCRSG